MYVCLCEMVTSRRVRKVIGRGATTPEAIARACGAGRACGSCLPALTALLAEAGIRVGDARADELAGSAPNT